MQFDLASWLLVASIVLAGLYHSLSDDGAASLFDHFGSSFRLPPKLLPVVILVVGIGSGIIDAKTAGADWQHAAIAALKYSLGGVFGAGALHAYQSKNAGAAAVLLIAVALSSLSGCAWWDKNGKTVEQAVLSASQLACVEASQFTSSAEVATACSIDAALVPVLEQLLAQKAAAHKAGFVWHQPGTDAGAP